MASEPNSVEGWRRLAADARATANKLTDPEARRELLAIAERYELLAARAEKRRNKDKPS